MDIKHIGIIMDGNRRWARKNKLKILAGHNKAARETIEPLIDTSISFGVEYLTLWAFSTENWQRDPQEVTGLMTLFRSMLHDNIERFHKKGVRVLYIGDITKFPKDIQEKIEDGVEKTKKNSTLSLVFALNYGGRDEILRAMKKSYELHVRRDELTQEKLSSLLDTADVPDPDLIIRTGGEKRLSGFLMWQAAYAELYFTDVLFPDFTPQEFKKALNDFETRQRRFGT